MEFQHFQKNSTFILVQDMELSANQAHGMVNGKIKWQLIKEMGNIFMIYQLDKMKSEHMIIRRHTL